MKELKVQLIRNGTVIDHITCGMALKVLKILSVDENIGSTVSVLMHVPSTKIGWKDVVKIEDRELDPQEVDKIALIAPNATINIIRNYNVSEKHKVSLPETVKGIVRCDNPSCITNQNEPVVPEFSVEKGSVLRCKYCERELENVVENFL